MERGTQYALDSYHVGFEIRVHVIGLYVVEVASVTRMSQNSMILIIGLHITIDNSYIYIYI